MGITSSFPRSGKEWRNFPAGCSYRPWWACSRGAAGIGMVWWLVAGKTREPRLLCDGKAAPPLVAAPHDSAEERRVVYSVPRMGWQGNTIRKGAKRPENRVTRFPVEKVRRSRIRGPPEVANSAECLARFMQQKGNPVTQAPSTGRSWAEP